MSVQPVSGTVLDRIRTWLNGIEVSQTHLARSLNFSTAFSITENAPYFDIDIGTLGPGQIPSSVLQNNKNNDFGAFYFDIDQIPVPSNPPTGKIRVFMNSSNGQLSAVDSGGSVHLIELPVTAKGSNQQSGNGSTTVFNIAHGFGSTPAFALVNAASSAAAGSFYVTVNATNISINYTTAPASGTNNLTWWYYATLT